MIVLKTFKDLAPAELYEILKLRNAVFIVEQDCPYQDIDGLDMKAWHLMNYQDDQLIGYTRIFTDDPAIGRVIIHSDYRGRGLARNMMLSAIDFLVIQQRKKAIKLQAQTYLINFYKSLGFYSISDEYLEDGIPHVDMVFTVN